MNMRKGVEKEKTLNYQSFIMNEGCLFKTGKTYYVFVKLIEVESGTEAISIVVAYDCKKSDYVALSLKKHGQKEVTLM